MSDFDPKTETRCREMRRSSRNRLECSVCKDNIYAGDLYRERIVADGDGDGFERQVAHTACVNSDPEWDTFQLQEADRSLEAIRRVHGLRWRVGQTVTFLGLPAELLGGVGASHVQVRQNDITKTVAVAQATLG
jgi:hypothetical protein